MRKTYYLFLLVMLMAGCQEQDRETYNVSLAKIIAPTNNETLEMEDGGSYLFTWNDADSKPQVIVFGSDAELTEKYYYLAGSGGECKLTTSNLSKIAMSFGAEVETPFDLFWTVVPAANIRMTPSDVRTLTIVVPKIEVLLGPVNETIDLDGNENNTVEFNWRGDALPENPTLALVFKSSLSATTDVVVDITATDNSCTLTDMELQTVLAKLGVKPGTTQALYWNLRDKKTSTDIGLVPVSFTTIGKTSVFVDVRGSETIIYKTAKVTYSDGTTDIWLAEGLRTKKYPNGDDFPFGLWSDGCVNPGYTGDYAKYAGFQYHNGKFKTVVPKYWRLPTVADFEKLVSSADVSDGGLAVLVAENLWTNLMDDVTKMNAWGLNFVSCGRASAGGMSEYKGVGENVGFWCSGIESWKLLSFDGSTTLAQEWTEGGSIRLILEK